MAYARGHFLAAIIPGRGRDAPEIDVMTDI